MTPYDFEGVGLDWEYPRAEDRSGRSIDSDNFPKFLSRVKSALSRANKGATITIPASYWYLQHFDIKSMVRAGFRGISIAP